MKLKVQKFGKKNAQLNKEEARQLRGLVGQLNWVSIQTRHDMVYSACEVSVSTKNATTVWVNQRK